MEIINLKNELNKANNIIEQQKLTINNLQNQLFNKNNNNLIQIQSLQNIIYQKEQEINILKSQLNNNINNKKLIRKDQMMVVNFISMDQRVHYAVPCIYNNTFAEVEENLYKQYPEYRETNNRFLANGKEILRFKTIRENNIGNGFPVTLVIPS